MTSSKRRRLRQTRQTRPSPARLVPACPRRSIVEQEEKEEEVLEGTSRRASSPTW